MSKGFDLVRSRRPRVGEQEPAEHRQLVGEIRQAESRIASGACPNRCGELRESVCVSCGFTLTKFITEERRQRGAGFNRRYVPKVGGLPRAVQ